MCEIRVLYVRINVEGANLIGDRICSSRRRRSVTCVMKMSPTCKTLCSVRLSIEFFFLLSFDVGMNAPDIV